MNSILDLDLATSTPLEEARAIPQVRFSKDDFKGFNPLFFNRMQKIVNKYGGRRVGVKAGRATGKTVFLAVHIIKCAQSIVRGCGMFGGPSLKSLFTKTQPSLISSFEQIYGYQEGREFVRTRPNPKWHWPTPLDPPKVYDNSLVFYTGHITYFTSILSKASGNGLNLTDLTIDEARYVPFAKLIEEVYPALRGRIYDNRGWDVNLNPKYLSMMFASDAAVTHEQMEWEKEWLKYETPEENAILAEMLRDLEDAPELMMIPAFRERLDAQRCKCGHLFTFPTLYNIDTLPGGEDYIRNAQLTMPPMLFDVQIMSKSIDDGMTNPQYYFCFNPEVHCYTPNEWDETCRILGHANKTHSIKDGYGGTREWEAPDLKKTARHADDDLYDVDIDPKYPLCLSWDLNANFNTVVISQRIPHGRRVEVRIVNCLYTKYKEKLRALLSKFNAYYQHHKAKNKHLKIIFDSTMRQGASYSLEDTNTRYLDVIQAVLGNCGWELELEDMKRPMLHEEKFQLINDMFAGQTIYDIRINKELDFLTLALTKAQVIQTEKGPKKDKGKEKLKSETGIGEKLEERTDVTDALDQALIAAVKGDFGTAPVGTRGVHFILPTIM